MSGFPILDLVIGMIFIYFILSIICSSIVEIILTSFRLRSRYLGKWLRTIFDKRMIQPDGTTLKLGQAIMDHCMATALAKPGIATSYIDSKNFVSALMEKVTFNLDQPDKVAQSLDDVLHSIEHAKAIDGTSLLSTELKRTLLIIGNEVKLHYRAVQDRTASDFELFRIRLENWYDMNMDRVTGSLKRRFIRPLTFWVGVVVAVGLNADSIRIVKYLYSNPEARKRVAVAGYEASADSTLHAHMDALARLQSHAAATDTVAAMQQAVMKDLEVVASNIKGEVALLNDLIPLGWGRAQSAYFSDHVASTIGGWLATVMAIMLGAPFWFDLLNKVGNLRGAGPRPATRTDKERKLTGTEK